MPRTLTTASLMLVGAFLDASKYCVKVTNNNKLSTGKGGDIEKILELFSDRKDVENIAKLVPNEEIVDPRFLYYLLKFNKDRIAGMGSGTTFMEVSGGVMKNVEVSLPVIAIQKHIAEILSSIDDKIELNNRINHNLTLIHI